MAKLLSNGDFILYQMQNTWLANEFNPYVISCSVSFFNISNMNIKLKPKVKLHITVI